MKFYDKIIGKIRRHVILPLLDVSENEYFVQKEIDKRAKLQIFDYETLSKDLEICMNYKYFNHFYGHDKVVKKALGLSELPSNMVIEHGIYFGDFFTEINQVKEPQIITMGSQREEYLKEKGYAVTAIGPYIKYVDFYRPMSYLKRIKRKYGKILLVFPTHSVETDSVDYNINQFIDEIKKHAIDFDSVFVCMYWKDVQEGKHLQYLREGFTIVTAGNRWDPNFLSRLKDVLWLSDMTMSNDLGTFIGYALYMGKAYYYFDQDKLFYDEKGAVQRQDDDKIKRNKILFSRCFGNYSVEITEEQRNLVRRYWGD